MTGIIREFFIFLFIFVVFGCVDCLLMFIIVVFVVIIFLVCCIVMFTLSSYASSSLNEFGVTFKIFIIIVF